MANEDNLDFRFKVFKKSFEYFQQQLLDKKETEKSIRLKLLTKSVENVNSSWPELEGLNLVEKILDDESLQDKLFEIDEVYEVIIKNSLNQQKKK